ncbi:MAG: type II secretion system minor pseudopilin GspI [Coxiellaceae bacterium]|nr:type II secretion system minor pseudopilin GspI [Coxiellaceae bacterium]
MRTHKAFTLIEVLVALVIIAIACAAVIRAMSQGVLTTTHLQTSIVSRWIAGNVLAQLQNGALPSLRDNAEQNGKVSMWNRQWTWAANASDSSSSNYYQQVQIYVGDPKGKKKYFHLAGFVWDPPKQQAAQS